MNLSTAEISAQTASRPLENSNLSKAACTRPDGVAGQRARSRGSRALRDHAAAVLMDHRQRAAGQIAQAVGEVRIVAADQRVVAEAAVLPEDDLRAAGSSAGRRRPSPCGWARRARCCRAICSSCRSRTAASRARRCAWAAAARRPSGTPASRWRGSARSPCRSGAGRPARGLRLTLAFDRAHVGGQRVEPDVEDVRRFAGHRDAPFDIGAA